MKFTSKCGIHNEFDIEVKDIRTGEIRQRGKAYNILLNNVYSRLCNRKSFFDSISFGRGTGAVDLARTALFGQIASLTAATVEEIRDVTNNIYYRKRKIVLLPANYVGETITEVGIYGGTLNSHALIQDAEGNQIAIGPKTAYDEITIYATVYFQLYNDPAGRIQWTNLPNGNALLNYLFGGTVPSPSIRAGQSRAETINTGSSILASLGSKSASYTADIPNRLFKTPVVTFETAEANGDVFEIALNNIFRSALPIPGLWEGYNVTGEAVGTGDGVNKNFNLKQNFVDVDTAVIKVDEVPMVKDVDYVLGPIKKDKIIGFPFFNTNNFITATQNPQNAHWLIDGITGEGSLTYTISDLPQDVIVDFGAVNYWNIGGIRRYNGSTNLTSLKEISISISSDNQNWTPVSNVIFVNSTKQTWEEQLFSTITNQFRYLKITIISAFSTATCAIREIEFIVKGDQLVFTNPVPAAAAVTADYHIDQIPKDENHTLGVSFEIQWGEGSAS